MMSWNTIRSETLVNDYHVTVKKNVVELPGGNRLDDFTRCKFKMLQW